MQTFRQSREQSARDLHVSTALGLSSNRSTEPSPTWYCTTNVVWVTHGNSPQMGVGLLSDMYSLETSLPRADDFKELTRLRLHVTCELFQAACQL